MEGARAIHRVVAQNFLSFGPTGIDVQLEPLNVIIGPNATGKSNFLEVFRLVHALANNVNSFIEDGSSADDYFWKGPELASTAHIAVEGLGAISRFKHNFTLGSDPFDDGFTIDREEILTGGNKPIYRNDSKKAGYLTGVQVELPDGTRRTEERWEELPDGLWSSIVSRSTDISGPSVSNVRSLYDSVRLYGSLSFGKNAAPRRSQKTDLDQSYLFEDGSNLANIIAALQHQTPIMRQLNDCVRDFHPRALRLVTGLLGQKVHLFLEEEGLVRTIPANRLSDGTIRFLCMATVFLQPTPPRVVCIEEPELGLHPDVIRQLAAMMIVASKRMQIIVTTHSDILVSALRDVPEAILVASREASGTTLSRLKPTEIGPWLENFSLGELWLSGEIGGVKE